MKKYYTRKEMEDIIVRLFGFEAIETITFFAQAANANISEIKLNRIFESYLVQYQEEMAE